MRDLNSNIVPLPEPALAYPSRQAGRAVTKVVLRCQDAKEDQRLDLSECQLMQVPDAVYHLMRNTILLWINLSSNVLRRIPPKFAFKFSAITELNLSHNHISSLPDELGDLNDLQRLGISHNHFMSLPRVVFNVPNLTHLNAEKNFISDIEISRLRSAPALQEVNLQNNPLTRDTHQQLLEVATVTIHMSEPQEQEDDMELNDIED